MITKEMNAALNVQMGKEFGSAYVYLSMSSYFQEEELLGFANFFKIQAQEELIHAIKIYDYIHDAGGNVHFPPIPEPSQTYTSILESFEAALKNERELSQDIFRLMQMALEGGDHSTRVFLQWFVTEQMEEENLFKACVKKVKLAGNDGPGLLFLDQEFSKRTLPPTQDTQN